MLLRASSAGLVGVDLNVYHPYSFTLAISIGQFIFSTISFSPSNEENDKHC